MACAGAVVIVSVNSCESVVRADQRSTYLLLSLFLVTVIDFSSDQQVRYLAKKIPQLSPSLRYTVTDKCRLTVFCV
jgi:hypothetical protein